MMIYSEKTSVTFNETAKVFYVENYICKIDDVQETSLLHIDSIIHSSYYYKRTKLSSK